MEMRTVAFTADRNGIRRAGRQTPQRHFETVPTVASSGRPQILALPIGQHPRPQFIIDRDHQADGARRRLRVARPSGHTSSCSAVDVSAADHRPEREAASPPAMKPILSQITERNISSNTVQGNMTFLRPDASHGTYGMTANPLSRNQFWSLSGPLAIRFGQ